MIRGVSAHTVHTSIIHHRKKLIQEVIDGNGELRFTEYCFAEMH